MSIIFLYIEYYIYKGTDINYYSGNELYSAQLLFSEKIQQLMDFKNYRITSDLKISFLFSKSFSSFSKDLKQAESFLPGKNAMLTIVKSANKYDLLFHADIEDLS